MNAEAAKDPKNLYGSMTGLKVDMALGFAIALYANERCTAIIENILRYGSLELRNRLFANDELSNLVADLVSGKAKKPRVSKFQVRNLRIVNDIYQMHFDTHLPINSSNRSFQDDIFTLASKKYNLSQESIKDIWDDRDLKMFEQQEKQRYRGKKQS